MRAIYKAALGLAVLAIGAGAIVGDQQTRSDQRPGLAAADQPTSTSTTTTTKPRPTTTSPLPPPPPSPPAQPVTTAKPTTKPTPPPTSKPPAPKPAAPCSAAARACVDLSANRSWLLSGGRVIYGPVPITHGRPGYRTPAGTFRVQWKDIDHKSSLFDDAPMPYSVFFNGGIAFHAGSLSQTSHGCIHLSLTAAKMYYNTLRVGDIVQVVP